MSFYSDLIESPVFTGGTYYGQGHYLTGMVSGATYDTNSYLFSLKRVSMGDLTTYISGGTSVLQQPEFANYTAYSQNIINNGLSGVTNNATLDVTLAKWNQTVSGTVASLISGRVVGTPDLVPQLIVQSKGRATFITDTGITRRGGNVWGFYPPNVYVTVPRVHMLVTATSAVGTPMNNRVHCFPFFTSKPYRLVEIGESFSDTAATESVKFAIYDGINGRPGKLLYDVGLVNPTTATYRGLLTSAPLSGSTYFACAWGSTSSPNVHYHTANVWFSLSTTSNTGNLSNSPSYGYVTLNPNFNGAWPDPYTGATIGLTGDTVPFLVLRFSGLTSL